MASQAARAHHPNMMLSMFHSMPDVHPAGAAPSSGDEESKFEDPDEPSAALGVATSQRAALHTARVGRWSRCIADPVARRDRSGGKRPTSSPPSSDHA